LIYVLAYFFVKVPRPGISERNFSVFESSCHFLSVYPSQSRMAVRYGTVRICMQRTLEKNRTVPAYRTFDLKLKQNVPYHVPIPRKVNCTTPT